MARPRKPRASMPPEEFWPSQYSDAIRLRDKAILNSAWTAAGRVHAMALEAYQNIPRPEEATGSFAQMDDTELLVRILIMAEQLPQEVAQQIFITLADKLGYPLGPRLVGE